MIIRRWRQGVLLATVAAVAVTGVLLVTQPWSSEPVVQEAVGDTIQQRICDVVMDIPPRGQGPDIVGVGPRNPPDEGQLRGPEMLLRVQGRGAGIAQVLIDALTGAVLEEQYYQGPAQKAIAKQVLRTVRVEPLDPSNAPWPYTDATQVPVASVGEKGIFQYRFPDPGSGLMISKSGAWGVDFLAHGLRMENCRSLLEILVTFPPGAEPEVTVTRDIHPDDEDAFQTFYDQVTINKDALGR